jgi:Predicted kinase
MIGLNGVQGIGKTTLVRVLSSVLNNQEGYPTLVASIDDFYLTREDQVRLSEGGNKLWEQRGLPGTFGISFPFYVVVVVVVVGCRFEDRGC